jgi:hypothetical protein
LNSELVERKMSGNGERDSRIFFKGKNQEEEEFLEQRN